MCIVVSLLFEVYGEPKLAIKNSCGNFLQKFERNNVKLFERFCGVSEENA